MPGLLSECQDLFGTGDLYEVLNIKKDAKPNESKFIWNERSFFIISYSVNGEIYDLSTYVINLHFKQQLMEAFF